MPGPDTNSARSRPIILLPVHQPSLQSMLDIGKAIQDDGRFHPVIVLAYPELEPDPARLSGGDVEWLRLYDMKPDTVRPSTNAAAVAAPGGTPGAKAFRIRAMARALLPERLRRSWPFEVIGLLVHLKKYQEQAQRIFDRFAPVALLLSGDRHTGVEPAFIRVARERNCLTVVMPLALSDLNAQIATYSVRVLHHVNAGPQRLLKKWIRYRYPQQIYQANQELLHYPPANTLALAMMNMLPPNPWRMMGGGYSDVLAVAGEKDREQSILWGVPASKIVVTGQPAHDKLYQAAQQAAVIRERLTQEHMLSKQSSFVIYAVPQLAEHFLNDRSAYWQAVETVVEALAQTGTNVLLSLHPKSSFDAYRFLEEKYGVHLLNRSLNEVLPVADLFVASYSSTIEWAVLLNIPTLLADPYTPEDASLNVHIFDHLAGVIRLTDESALARTLDKVLHDRSYYEHLKAEQRKAAARLAPFDGQAIQRIIAVIERHWTGSGDG